MMLKSMILGVSLMCMSAFAMANNKIWSAKDAEAFLESEGIPSLNHKNIVNTNTVTLSNIDVLNKYGNNKTDKEESYKKDWKLFKCERDRFDNNRICGMYKNKVLVMIVENNVFVGVGHTHVPYKQSAIKIDSQPTIYGMEGLFKENNKIIKQMLKGQTLYYRYYELPNDYSTDESISLDDFKQSYEKLWQLYHDIE